MPRKSSHKAVPTTDQISVDIDEAIFKMMEVRALILGIGDGDLNLLADLLLYRIGQIGVRSLARSDLVVEDRRVA